MGNREDVKGQITSLPSVQIDRGYNTFVHQFLLRFAQRAQKCERVVKINKKYLKIP